MAFIFADLIVPNILDTYRRYYGLKLAAVLFLCISVNAVIAGVMIHYLWHALDLVPAQGQVGGTAPDGYTLYLNIFFTCVLLAQIALAKWRGGASEEPIPHNHTDHAQQGA